MTTADFTVEDPARAGIKLQKVIAGGLQSAAPKHIQRVDQEKRWKNHRDGRSLKKTETQTLQQSVLPGETELD